jgi:uncharacterized membrane protein YgcG
MINFGNEIVINLPMFLALFLPIIFAGITIFLWYRFGRDERVVETVEFYPPEGYNSAEIGFLYRGEAKATDVVSLLIYLADKGYIAISEYVEKTLFLNKKAFKIFKLKEYDGDDPNERLFLSGLFEKKSEVTKDDLQDVFYTTLLAIIKDINRKENKETIFEKSSLYKNFFVFIMVVAIFALITGNLLTEFDGFTAYDAVPTTPVWPFLIIFPCIGLLVIIGALASALYTKKGYMFLFNTGLGYALMFSGMFACILFAVMILPALPIDQMYLLTYIIGTISVTGMLFIAKYMTKRTAYGTEILGKIRGFKNFLATAEKPRLEALVMQNPSYFYNILPFTYVLGVSDKWIKKFESIALVSPDWYSGTDTFSSASFGSFVNQTMKTASSAMTSIPSSGDGGGGFGGGSSGGGSGGGGGRSW